MAYNNRQRYNSYNRYKYNEKPRSGKKIRNRIIIITAGLIIFALIIALISSVVSCICTGTTHTDPTVNTATIGSAKNPADKDDTVNIKFKEPNIKDDNSEAGSFDGEYYIWDSKAFQAFKGTKKNAKSYAKFINKTKDKFGLSINIYSAIVPTHIEMGLPNRMKNTDDGIQTKSQADYTKAAYKRYTKKVKFINDYNLISDHCNDYIFFDSDKSLTGLGGYYVYKSFADSMKKKAITLESCKENTIEEFYGGYNNLTDTDLNVDKVQYWDFPYKLSNTITNSDGEQSTTDSCYNKEAESGAYAKNVFLYGDNPLEVIKSESDKAEGKIAIVHNSYSNPVVPYFTYNYKEVYSIDYTLYNGDLKDLCIENGISNVLFLNDAQSTTDSEDLASLKKITAGK